MEVLFDFVASVFGTLGDEINELKSIVLKQVSLCSGNNIHSILKTEIMKKVDRKKVLKKSK